MSARAQSRPAGPRAVAIVPCPDPITGGVQADLRIVEELRVRGWEVRPVYLQERFGAPVSYGWWDQVTFNLRLLRLFWRAPRGSVFLEDQALSGAVAVFNWYIRLFRGARIALLTYHLVFTLWRNPLRRVVRRLVEGAVARHVDAVIASSESTRRDLLALGVADRRIHVVPLGMGRPPAEVSGSRTCDDPAVRLLTVGTVEPRKGIEPLLRALAGLDDRLWRLDIVGSLQSDYADSMLELAERLGMASRVRFHGRVGDEALEEFLAGADIYVQPSTGEGFGLAVVEAMTRGLAVVASDAGSLPEVVEDGQTGILFHTGKVDELQVALARVIDDPGLRERLGRAAASAVAGRYSWKETGRRVATVLSTLMSGGERNGAREPE